VAELNGVLPSSGRSRYAGKESTLKEKPKEYALEYAGFWIRLAASLVDFLLLMAGLYILYCVISQSFFWIFPGINKLIDTFGDIARGAPVSAGLIWLVAIMLLIFLAGSTGDDRADCRQAQHGHQNYTHRQFTARSAGRLHTVPGQPVMYGYAGYRFYSYRL